MDLFSEKEVKNFLQKQQIKPQKRLGQHFLIDKNALKKIIKAANLNSGDIVLEIGPGLAVLTQELAKRVRKVIAVEKDAKMCQALKELLDCWNIKNVEIIQGDIRFLEIRSPRYKVVANLPFYLTAPVIRKFLEAKNPPKGMVLVVQKEVGQRICAVPPQMSILAVSVQFYAKPEIISYIPRTSFWPQPKVDSAILRIAPLIDADRKLINTDLFFKIVKAGFLHPRKQIINNLSTGLKMEKHKIKTWLLKNKISASQRAETLSIKDWIKLAKSLQFLKKLWPAVNFLPQLRHTNQCVCLTLIIGLVL